MNAKEISKFEGSAQSHEQLESACGRLRSGNDANLSLERRRTLLLQKKKNAFTFTATAAEVRSTLQTFFNI